MASFLLQAQLRLPCYRYIRHTADVHVAASSRRYTPGGFPRKVHRWEIGDSPLSEQ